MSSQSPFIMRGLIHSRKFRDCPDRLPNRHPPACSFDEFRRLAEKCCDACDCGCEGEDADCFDIQPRRSRAGIVN